MPYRLKNLRVLLIDDNDVVRQLIRTLLVDLGFGMVDDAADTERGWEYYSLRRPDAILVDWRLGNDDGLEFVRRVRRDPSSHSRDVSIIMMTSYPNRERLMQARDAGVTEFLTKPFTVEALASHFTQLIEKPRDFIQAPNFTGPDRRRRSDEIDDEERKRRHEKHLAQQAAAAKQEKAAEKPTEPSSEQPVTETPASS